MTSKKAPPLLQLSTMQHPTCTDLRIRSTQDAQKIFAAVKHGLLHMVSRRLDADERLALRSGCIYAWEERGPHTETTGLGIERFTEGRRWSPSRVRDEFLFYYEKYSTPQDPNNPGGKSVEVKPPRDWDPLVKQTYSVWVETEKGRRKWHLTAYFTQATIDHLGTVDDIPRIRELVIPEGMFKSTRLGKNRSRPDENKSSDVSKTVTSRSSYAALPSPYQYRVQSQRGSPGLPVFMHEPYQARRSAEPQSPATYETSHTPISHDGGHYQQSQVVYPNGNGHPFPLNSYHRPSVALPNPISSFKPNSRPSPPRQDVNSYYPTNDSPTSWSDENGLDYNHSPPQQRLSDLGVPSSTPLQSSYGPENGSFDYTYQTPASTQNPEALYSAPYTMNSGYAPMSSPPTANPPNPGGRGVHLSPLSIPARSSHGGNYPQDSSPISPDEPTLQTVPESYARTAVPSLAPLNLIRRPTHRREPLDEMTLRMLRASQANP